MKHWLITIFYASLIISISCGGKNVLFESLEARARIRNGIEKYTSVNWDIRLQAIQGVTKYIQTSHTDDSVLYRENNLNFQLLVALLTKATHDDHSLIRIEALKGLMRILPKQSFERIKDMAQNENENDNVRTYAIETLSLYHNPETFPVFIQGLQNDDWIVREASISGMLKFENDVYPIQLIPHIIQCITDPNEGVNIAVLEHVTIKDENIYSVIAGKFIDNKKKSTLLVKAFLQALKGYHLDFKTREKVINLLGSEDVEIRIRALRVLKEEKSVNK